MTQEKFEKAKELETRIRHISQAIDILNKYEYTLDMPLRQSNFSIFRFGSVDINLNEGEVVIMRKALEDERARLRQEFGRL